MMNEITLGPILSLGVFLFIVIGILVAVSYLERDK